MRHCVILYSVSLGRIRMYTGNNSLYSIKYAHTFYVYRKVSNNFTQLFMSFEIHAVVKHSGILFHTLVKSEEQVQSQAYLSNVHKHI